MEKPWSYVFEEGGGKGLAMLTMATLTMATLTMRHAHYGHAREQAGAVEKRGSVTTMCAHNAAKRSLPQM